MTTLITIEDALLARAELVVGSTARAYKPLPGGIAQLAALLGRNLVVPPSIFAAWVGSERRATAAGLQLVSAWALIAVVQHPLGEVARRRGDGTVPGAYALAELLAAALHDYTLAGVGTCTVLRLAPIDAPALEQMAVSIADCRISITHDVEDWGTLRLDTLPPFETFAADYDLAPPDGTPEASDIVTLEQAT